MTATRTQPELSNQSNQSNRKQSVSNSQYQAPMTKADTHLCITIVGSRLPSAAGAATARSMITPRHLLIMKWHPVIMPARAGWSSC